MTAEHRAIPLAADRWLLFPRHLGDGAVIDLHWPAGQPPQVQPRVGDLLDLPFDTRRAVVASVRDWRMWGNRPVEHRQALGSQERAALGIPTAQGTVTPHSIMSEHLSSPGAIRTEADQALAKVFERGTGSQHQSMAKLGTDLVAIKDQSQTRTRLALYDARTKSFKRDLKIRGLPDDPACSLADAQDEHLFNDDRGALYLLRGRSGDVFALDDKLQSRFVARLPELVGRRSDACGASRSAGAVLDAVQMPSGQLLIATRQRLLLQQGKEFFEVPAPAFPLQIAAHRPGEVLLIAPQGLARVALPKSFTGPSRVQAGVADQPDDEPCGPPQKVRSCSRSDATEEKQ